MPFLGTIDVWDTVSNPAGSFELGEGQPLNEYAFFHEQQ